jgi:hypothetical protein
MSAAALVRQAHDDGLELTATPAGNIKVRGPREAVARWRPVLIEHKPEIIRELANPAGIVSLDDRRAAVERMRDAMSAETAARRDWHKQPVDGWREGRLEWRSLATGERTVIRFRKPKGERS